MLFELAKHWWSFLIRGILGVVAGIVAFMWPGITLITLVLLFGAYAFIDGAVNIAGAVHAIHARDRWGALLAEGILGLVAAGFAWAWPGKTALALVLVIGFWAIVTGIAEIAAAFRLRRYIEHEWLLGLAGLASVIFGVLVMAVPAAGALAIALWFGVYAFIFGIVLIALAFRLRHWGKEHPAGGPIPAPAH